MYQFDIRIAGHVIRVVTAHENARVFCRDFLTEEMPAFCVRVEQRDIDRVRGQSQTVRENDPRLDGVFEISTLHEVLTLRLLDEDVLLLHGAVIAVDGEAYLFTGPSGTGKTTQIWRWLDRLPDAVVVNGDKPYIRFSDDGTPPLACGSPWAGKENMYADAMVPLKAIVLMERAEENRMRPVSLFEAFPALLQQTYRPEDPEKQRQTLRLLRRLDPAVSFWHFRCNNMKDDAFPTAYRALTGREP